MTSKTETNFQKSEPCLLSIYRSGIVLMSSLFRKSSRSGKERNCAQKRSMQIKRGTRETSAIFNCNVISRVFSLRLVFFLSLWDGKIIGMHGGDAVSFARTILSSRFRHSRPSLGLIYLMASSECLIFIPEKNVSSLYGCLLWESRSL